VGVSEDPATGIASGPLGCYLVRHGVVAPEKAGAMLSLQGVKMLRPSRIHISIDSAGDSISRVRVGGRSVLVGEREGGTEHLQDAVAAYRLALQQSNRERAPRDFFGMNGGARSGAPAVQPLRPRGGRRGGPGPRETYRPQLGPWTAGHFPCSPSREGGSVGVMRDRGHVPAYRWGPQS